MLLNSRDKIEFSCPKDINRIAIFFLRPKQQHTVLRWRWASGSHSLQKAQDGNLPHRLKPRVSNGEHPRPPHSCAQPLLPPRSHGAALFKAHLPEATAKSQFLKHNRLFPQHFLQERQPWEVMEKCTQVQKANLLQPLQNKVHPCSLEIKRITWISCKRTTGAPATWNKTMKKCPLQQLQKMRYRSIWIRQRGRRSFSPAGTLRAAAGPTAIRPRRSTAEPSFCSSRKRRIFALLWKALSKKKSLLTLKCPFLLEFSVPRLFRIPATFTEWIERCFMYN